jgi:protein-S-isoprenylcysteine O-methyltransferase Ste14
MAFVAAPMVWGGAPWAISLLTPHHGWAAGRPGFWNLLGLIPVVVGTVGLFWMMSLHFAQAPKKRIELELAQRYLLRQGPYAVSRHPMYLSELTLLFGWVIFYGSVAVLMAFAVACAVFNLVNVPLEERALEARFGQAYREYKRRVPRWFGVDRKWRYSTSPITQTGLTSGTTLTETRMRMEDGAYDLEVGFIS